MAAVAITHSASDVPTTETTVLHDATMEGNTAVAKQPDASDNDSIP